MGRALFIVAVLAAAAYAMFFRNMAVRIPQPHNQEQKYMHAAGDESGSDHTVMDKDSKDSNSN